MPNVNDVYRVTTLGSVSPSGEPILNTWYYRISVVGAGDEKAALANAFAAAGNPYPTFLAAMPTLYSCLRIAVQPVKPIGTVELVVPVSTAGTVAGATMPNQCSIIITRKTATFGKGGRGRLFVGPIPLSVQAANDPNFVVTTYCNTLVTAMLNTLVSGGWSFVPVLWKRKTNVSLDLTNTSTNFAVKTRRSRAEGTRFHRRKRHTVGSI